LGPVALWCAERLSAITRISCHALGWRRCQRGTPRTLPRVWRAAVLPSTSPVLVFEGGIQRHVRAGILKAVPLSPTRGERQDRIEPIQRWIASFSSTQNTAALLRGMQIKSDDLGSFVSNSGSFRGHVTLEPVVGAGMLAPHSRDHHVTEC